MANSKELNVGGYDVLLVSILPEKFRCQFCKKLMKDVVQTFRGERACGECYRNAKGDSMCCPIDNEPIEDHLIFPDKHAQREILQLPCHCNNKHNGCPWLGNVIEVQKHLPTCQFKSVVCTKCGISILLKDKKYHDVETCVLRQVACMHCKESFSAQSLEEHLTTCVKKPKECPYRCGKDVTLNDLYDHMKVCQNVNAGNACPYEVVGCKYKANGPKDVKKHLQENVHIHTGLTIATVQSMNDTNNVLYKDIQSERTIREQLALQLEQEMHERSALEGEVQKLQEKFWEIEKLNTSQKDLFETRIVELETTISEHTKRGGVGSEELREKMAMLSSRYDGFERKMRNQNADSSGKMPENTVELATQIDETVSKIDPIESNHAVVSANLADLELKLQLLENTSYDGRQIWKIDNLHHRRQQAVLGKVTALHSAPCFTKRGGYKFCTRLYLNGDGMGKDSYVSLFFVMMKSEFDALMQWPFSYRVTFRLINHDDSRESVKETFLPDRNSSSFQRPTRDMNIAAGCPMFVEKTRLDMGNFIVDDTLFIETMVSVP